VTACAILVLGYSMRDMMRRPAATLRDATA
jgi:hypothetical protein